MLQQPDPSGLLVSAGDLQSHAAGRSEHRLNTAQDQEDNPQLHQSHGWQETGCLTARRTKLRQNVSTCFLCAMTVLLT